MSRSGDGSSDRDASNQMCVVDEDTHPDSIFSSSESSQSGSTSQGIASNVEEPKRCRTEDGSKASHERAKRTKFSYNDGYRKVFNETLIDVISSEGASKPSLPPSQIGATLWSPEEKDLLFASIARRSRHDIQRIATDIGSKSESEIKVFIEKVEDAAKNEQIYEMDPRRLLKPSDLNAAVEVSEPCCTRLDLAADALSKLQYQEEKQLEKEKYGDFSLLTSSEGKWAHQRFKLEDSGEDEVSKFLPEARLLNLKMFLTVSKRIFMNSKVIENNWRSCAERRESPSIMYTAFSAFHTLMVSLTKRVVQSAIFFAMSRLKAMDASGQYSPRRHVRRGDVVAALGVLGLELNGKRTWAGVARKCRLRVYDGVRYRQTYGKRYSYDEVEANLSSEPKKTRGRSMSSHKRDVYEKQADSFNNSSNDEAENPHISNSEQVDSSSSFSSDETQSSGSSVYFPSDNNVDKDDEDDSSSPLSGSEGLVNHTERKAHKQELLERSQDAYAEALDQRASRVEESRLWKLLGEDPSKEMKSENITLPKAFPRARKGQDDLVDWSTRIDYVQEWERYEAPLPAAVFMEKEKARRSSRSAAGLTDSEDELEELMSSEEDISMPASPLDDQGSAVSQYNGESDEPDRNSVPGTSSTGGPEAARQNAVKDLPDRCQTGRGRAIARSNTRSNQGGSSAEDTEDDGSDSATT